MLDAVFTPLTFTQPGENEGLVDQEYTNLIYLEMILLKVQSTM